MLPIRFKPFVGKEYDLQDFKILVLGESHYLKKANYESYLKNEKRIEQTTNHVVNDFLSYKRSAKNHARWMNTFTKFGNVSNRKRLSMNETIKFWESIAFYNYVQVPTTGPRKSPKHDEFVLSYNAFKRVAFDLQPNLIFIWGYRLWKNFPREDVKKIEVDQGQLNIMSFDSNIPFKVLPHPSSSKFNYKLVVEIQDYKELARQFQNI